VKRIGIAFASVAMLVMALSGPMYADSPHFITASASVSGTNLVCSFKEAGLGTTVSTENVTCSANATAIYECINGGSNHPKAANKETVNGPVSGGGAFPVRNGSTTGTITVGPPSAGAFSCPSGQTLVLASVCYTDVVLSGSSGDKAPVSGTFCSS
jgi:hypothetical protein